MVFSPSVKARILDESVDFAVAGESRFGAVLAITTAEKVIIIGSLLLLAAWAGKGMTPLLASVGLVAGRVVGLIAATLISWSETARLTGTAEALGWVEPYRKARSLGSFLIVERGTAYVIPLLVVWTSGLRPRHFPGSVEDHPRSYLTPIRTCLGSLSHLL